MMKPEDAELQPALAALRDDVPPPPRELVDQIMRRTALLGRPRARPFTRLAWPTAWMAAGAFAALTLLLAVRHDTPPATLVAAPLAGDVLVRFALPAPQAETVFLSGEFNGWATDRLPLRRGPDGVWSATVPLPRGTFQYAYFVDGKFLADPLAESFRPDGFGGKNAVLRIGDPS